VDLVMTEVYCYEEYVWRGYMVRDLQIFRHSVHRSSYRSSIFIASLWPDCCFGFLFRSSVSSISRAPVPLHLRRCCQPLPLMWSSIDRSSLPPQFILFRWPLSLPTTPSPLVVLWIMLLLFLLFDGYGLGSLRSAILRRDVLSQI